MVEASRIKFSEPFPVNLEHETCHEGPKTPSPKPKRELHTKQPSGTGFYGVGARLTISQRIAKVKAPLKAMSWKVVGEGPARLCLVSAEDHNHGGEEQILRIPWSGCWAEANPISRS
jgi:hypothetical protein